MAGNNSNGLKKEKLLTFNLPVLGGKAACWMPDKVVLDAWQAV